MSSPWIGQVLADQRVFARNHKESRRTLLARMAWAVRFWFRGVRLGIQGIRELHIGSVVLYREKRWVVVNYANAPSMHLVGDDGQRESYVPKVDVTPIITPRELWHRFRYVKGWYVSYWLQIDVDERIWRRCR